MAGFPAVYGKQILYFKDETFLARARIPAPEKSDVFEQAKTKDQVQQEAFNKVDEKPENKAEKTEKAVANTTDAQPESQKGNAA